MTRVSLLAAGAVFSGVSVDTGTLTPGQTNVPLAEGGSAAWADGCSEIVAAMSANSVIGSTRSIFWLRIVFVVTHPVQVPVQTILPLDS